MEDCSLSLCIPVATLFLLVSESCIFIAYFLVSGNESYSESENSTNDDADSTHSNEPEVGLRSLLDDENEDEMNTEKKVCIIVQGFWYES
jgi:hypothetical protein